MDPTERPAGMRPEGTTEAEEASVAKRGDGDDYGYKKAALQGVEQKRQDQKRQEQKARKAIRAEGAAGA